jgi:phosphomannomutase
VVTPVSSNTAVDQSHWFETVERTRIGSPYVIAGMQALKAQGKQQIVGYEANGGFLIEDELTVNSKTLSALPTRDAVIVILSLLVAGKNQNITLSQLAAQLPERYTFSDRIKQIPTDKSQALIAGFDSGNEQTDKENITAFFDQQFGHVTSLNRTDGLRITFENGDIVHLRPSGNAPELRCYTEADSLQRATAINHQAMKKVRGAI